MTSLLHCDLPEIDQIANFKVGKFIGRGAMAFVFKARRENGLDRPLALKFLTAEHFTKDRIRSLERESYLSARLTHPHIISATEFGQNDEFAWAAFPYISGACLHKFVSVGNPIKRASEERKKRYQWLTDQFSNNWRNIARMGAQIASALQYCNDHDILHRDIKPANILIDRAGNAWLTDFGIAWGPDKRLQSGYLENSAGTPRFTAPEVFSKQRDQRSDLFSLGMVLYETAIGHQAWLGLNDKQLNERRPELVLPRIFHVQPAVPVPLIRIIEKALAEDPDQRFQSAREMESALLQFAYGADEPRQAFARTRSAERRMVRPSQSAAGLEMPTLTRAESENLRACISDA